MYVPAGKASLTSQAKVGVPMFCITRGYREVDELTFEWLRDGEPLPDQTDAIYVPVTADVSSTLACRVTAVKRRRRTDSRSGSLRSRRRGRPRPAGSRRS